MKKYPFFILMIPGLLACFAGCSDLFMNNPAEPDQEIPEGKAVVQWSVETQIGRTLFPSIPFSKFDVTFTSAGKEAITETFTGNSGEVILETGSWNIGVLAYAGDDPAAQGSALLQVRSGRTNSVTVSLKALDLPGGGTGSLVYDVTLPAWPLHAELSIVSLDGLYSTTISLAASPSDSISLSGGYYILTFFLRGADRQAGLTDLAHVYDGFSTSGVYDFSEISFAAAPEISVPPGGKVIYINSAAELAAIAGDITNSAKNNGKNAYILWKDIDLSAYSPWTPLGTETAPFAGYFFGDGYTIGGLDLSGASGDGIGLFGYTGEALIRNFNGEITGITLTTSGSPRVGIIAGLGEDTIFEDIRISVSAGGGLTVSGSEPAAGGLVGLLDSSRIERCGFAGNITVLSGGASAYAGGLAGKAVESEIYESYMAGLITHTNTGAGASVYTAGLVNSVETIYSPTTSVEDCYHNGTIRASGLSGSVLITEGLGGRIVSRSYAAGSIVNNGSGTGGTASGLSLGAVENSAALNLAIGGASAGRIGAETSGSYLNNIVLGNMVVNGSPISDWAASPENHKDGLGKTAAELQTQSTYAAGLGWDFGDVWEMGPSSYPYPILKWQQGAAPLPDAYGLVELPEDFTAEFKIVNTWDDLSRIMTNMRNYLTALPQNSPLDPYPVKVSGFELSAFVRGITNSQGIIGGDDPLGVILQNLAGKYVRLDLSACTGTAMPDLTHTSIWISYAALIANRLNKELLVSIQFPAGLTSIGGGVFDGCSSLSSLVCWALTPPSLVSGTLGTPSNLVIRVPADSVDDYKAAEGWSQYAAAISAIP
jgi:hypothetical protein